MGAGHKGHAAHLDRYVHQRHPDRQRAAGIPDGKGKVINMRRRTRCAFAALEQQFGLEQPQIVPRQLLRNAGNAGVEHQLAHHRALHLGIGNPVHDVAVTFVPTDQLVPGEHGLGFGEVVSHF